MVVTVETEPSFTASPSRVLFEGRYDRLGWNARSYDVTVDGQRFLMLKPEERPERAHLIIVQNWFEELKHLVPVP